MNRKPIYHPQNTEFRTISMPNGLWVAQIRDGERGLHTSDAWQSMHSPTTQVNALDYMYMKCPVRQAKAA